MPLLLQRLNQTPLRIIECREITRLNIHPQPPHPIPRIDQSSDDLILQHRSTRVRNHQTQCVETIQTARVVSKLAACGNLVDPDLIPGARLLDLEAVARFAVVHLDAAGERAGGWRAFFAGGDEWDEGLAGYGGGEDAEGLLGCADADDLRRIASQCWCVCCVNGCLLTKLDHWPSGPSNHCDAAKENGAGFLGVLEFDIVEDGKDDRQGT
jgi:hypothetical protein